jgi:shingomyelin synthase
MFVTVLPISSETYYCSPKSNATSTFDVIKRALTLFSGMGLSINNKQIYCGDSIFSGHTTILILAYLVIDKCMPFFLLSSSLIFDVEMFSKSIFNEIFSTFS